MLFTLLRNNRRVVSHVSQEAHEAFTEWFNHSGAAPQKPAPVPEAKFTERVANEMREKEYQVKKGRGKKKEYHLTETGC